MVNIDIGNTLINNEKTFILLKKLSIAELIILLVYYPIMQALPEQLS